MRGRATEMRGRARQRAKKRISSAISSICSPLDRIMTRAFYLYWCKKIGHVIHCNLVHDTVFIPHRMLVSIGYVVFLLAKFNLKAPNKVAFFADINFAVHKESKNKAKDETMKSRILTLLSKSYTFPSHVYR